MNYIFLLTIYQLIPIINEIITSNEYPLINNQFNFLKTPKQKSNSIIRFFKRERGDTIKENKLADQALKYH